MVGPFGLGPGRLHQDQIEVPQSPAKSEPQILILNPPNNVLRPLLGCTLNLKFRVTASMTISFCPHLTVVYT